MKNNTLKDYTTAYLGKVLDQRVTTRCSSDLETFVGDL